MDDAPRSTGTHAWRGSAPRKAPGEANTARKRKLLILGGIFLAVVGALAALLLYPQSEPKPTFVALVVDQYTDPRIPVAPWAEQDRQAIAALNKTKTDTFPSQQRTLLLKELESLGRNAPTDQPLIVYLRAFAASTADGVSILPGDATLDDPKTWLPISQVLAALKDCPVKNRLLLLDVTFPLADGRAGMLRDDVAEQLEPILKAAVTEDTGLAILSACAPGQASLASEEFGHSVFIHYVLQGLAGRADAIGEKKDGRVSKRELADFVSARTSRWAWHNRGVQQKPQFYDATEKDVQLCLADLNSATVTPLDKEYPGFLRTGWTKRDGWWKEQRRRRTAIEVYQKTEAALLRGEERWRAGVALSRIESDLGRQVADQSRIRAEALPEESDKDESLAAAEVRGIAVPEKDLAENRRRLKEMARLNGLVAVPKPDEKDVMRLMAERDKFVKSFEGKPFDLAWTVLRSATAEDRPIREEWRFWVTLLRPPMMPLPAELNYEEVQVFLRLADLPVRENEVWPSESIGLALKIAVESARARTVPPHWREWERWLNARPESERRAAEANLLAAGTADRLRSALAEYERNNRYLQTIQDDCFALDRALVLLPQYPVYLDQDGRHEDVWRESFARARRLDGLLAKPPPMGTPGEVLRAIETESRSLQDSLRVLRQPVDVERLRLLMDRRTTGGTADIREMNVLLQMSEWTADQRERLGSTTRTIAGRLDDGSSTADEPTTFDLEKAQRLERERGLRRARIALDRLERAGVGELADVRKALADASAPNADRTAWLALSDELRKAARREP